MTGEVHIEAVSETAEPGVFVVTLAAGTLGSSTALNYVLRPDDPFGLAPSIRAAIQQANDAGNPYPVAPYVAPPPDLAAFRFAIQGMLDEWARQRNYDSIQTAVTYRGDPNPVYAAEGEAAFTARSAVWSHTFTEWAKVEAGQRPPPSIETFVGELTQFLIWPT